MDPAEPHCHVSADPGNLRGFSDLVLRFFPASGNFADEALREIHDDRAPAFRMAENQVFRHCFHFLPVLSA